MIPEKRVFCEEEASSLQPDLKSPRLSVHDDAFQDATFTRLENGSTAIRSSMLLGKEEEIRIRTPEIVPKDANEREADHVLVKDSPPYPSTSHFRIRSGTFSYTDPFSNRDAPRNPLADVYTHALADIPPEYTSTPKHALLVLDLNGTLVHRKNPKPKTPIRPRPHLSTFLDACFTHFHVMVWSSARPHNVHRMVESIFTPAQIASLYAIWDRSHFGLTKREYDGNPITLKKLQRIRDKLEWTQDVFIVEDEGEKILEQDRPYWIQVNSWHGREEDTELERLAEWILRCKDNLQDAIQQACRLE